MKIEGKVVLITGAAKGIGLGITKHLLELGAKVAVVDRDNSLLNQADKELSDYGDQFKIYQTDVSNEEQVASTFEQVVQDFGTLDVLVNNAGILRDQMLLSRGENGIEKMDYGNFKKTIDVNLGGVLLCGREAAYTMAKLQTTGVIINLSSISRAGNMGQSSYAATKAGVVALSVTWAKELGALGIRSVAIAPGFIKTDMTDSMKPVMKDLILKMVPLRRIGEAEEIANSVEFILKNDYFNGRVLEIDGGLRI